MNTLDIAVLVAIGISTGAGALKGLVTQLFGILGLTVGALAAWLYHPQVAAAIGEVGPAGEAGAIAVAYVVIFLSVALASSLIGRALSRAVKFAMLGWLDRLGGGAYGFARALILSGGVILLLAAGLPNGSPILSESTSFQKLADARGTIQSTLPEHLAKILNSVLDRHQDGAETKPARTPSPTHSSRQVLELAGVPIRA